MVRFDRRSGAGAALDHVRVQGSLRQILCSGDIIGTFLENPYKLFADDLTLLFRIHDTSQSPQEPLARIHGYQPDSHRRREIIAHLLGLVFAQQAVIDEYAGQLIADGLVNQRRHAARIDTARNAAHNTGIADLGSDLLYRFVNEGSCRPQLMTSTDFYDKMTQKFLAKRCMRDF